MQHEPEIPKKKDYTPYHRFFSNREGVGEDWGGSYRVSPLRSNAELAEENAMYNLEDRAERQVLFEPTVGDNHIHVWEMEETPVPAKSDVTQEEALDRILAMFGMQRAAS